MKNRNNRNIINYLFLLIICVAMLSTITNAEETKNRKNTEIDFLQNQLKITQNSLQELHTKITDIETRLDSFAIIVNDGNIHKEANPESSITHIIKAGSTIQILEDIDNEWVKIDYGYIHKKIIKRLSETNKQQIKIKRCDIHKDENNEKQYNLNVTGKSGMDLDDIEYLIKDSPMVGTGKSILYIEDKYNVNAFFTISVAQGETSKGSAGTGASKHNLFGITLRGDYRTFKNFDECIYEFGGMMERVYFSKGRTTLEKVNQIYIPDNSWTPYIQGIMNSNLKKLNKK